MLDKLIIEFDRGLRTLFAPAHSLRPHPDEGIPEATLTEQEKRHVRGLMRVNHCGEICAQALYQGQALTAQSKEARAELNQAANEEIEHLAWTERRIRELGGRVSFLNPLWYSGSLAIGLSVGLLGEKWNLGFLEETERQVEAHLTKHLGNLPAHDQKSQAIVSKMRDDEREHANLARKLGAVDLPAPIKIAMKYTARLMTNASYYL